MSCFPKGPPRDDHPRIIIPIYLISCIATSVHAVFIFAGISFCDAAENLLKITLIIYLVMNANNAPIFEGIEMFGIRQRINHTSCLPATSIHTLFDLSSRPIEKHSIESSKFHEICLRIHSANTTIDLLLTNPILRIARIAPVNRYFYCTGNTNERRKSLAKYIRRFSLRDTLVVPPVICLSTIQPINSLLIRATREEERERERARAGEGNPSLRSAIPISRLDL